MLRRRRSEADALGDQVRDLIWLLNEERDRSDDLLEKLLFAMANSPAPQVVYPPALTGKAEAQWGWSDIQPEDEAKEDVQAQYSSGALKREEAEAVLESLGFDPTDLVDLDL